MRDRAGLFVLVCLVYLVSRPAWPDTVTGARYLEVPGSDCRVWSPSSLARSDYIPRYAGACKNGRAQGKGRLEWLLRFAEMKVQTVWEGNFDNGVFLADVPAATHVEPLPGDRYLVRVGAIEGGPMTIVATSAQTGPMHLCPAERVAVQLPDAVMATDDPAVRRIMREAADRYQSLCATAPGSPILEIYAAPVVADDRGNLPDTVARARFDGANRDLGSYTNTAVEHARIKLAQDAAQQRTALSQKQFDEFTSRHTIASWVTAGQLDANPFRYEGKTVGIAVRLERMVARDTALVSDALEGGGTVQLHGVTPEFPDAAVSVVIAARVGQRGAVADGTAGVFTNLTALESRPCARSDCSDWFGWSRGKNALVWGDPVSPH